MKPFATTGIGSLPFQSPATALEEIFSHTDIPFWPQLPRLGPYEGMLRQYTRELPSLTEKNGTLYFIDDEKTPELLASFYERYITGDPAPWKPVEPYSSSFEAFIKKASSGTWPCLKGHVTGPVTQGLGLFDSSRRPLLYNHQYRDILVKNSIMCARAQLEEMKKVSSSKKAIVFFDEPSLASFGTSGLSLDREELLEIFRELTSGTGSLTGIHCCSNTDWGLLMKAGFDFISFDAYSFSEKFLIYTEELKHYLEKGGRLAIGLIPTFEETIYRATPASLAERFQEFLKALKNASIDTEFILEESLLTPACGLGSVSVEAAQKALSLLHATQEEILRRFYSKIDF